MSVNRKMHPRNIFRNPPDYTALAIKYSDFRKVCKLELTGKVCVDYKNESALRALTRMLLKEHFELNVDFAPGSLVPTLPLRLNYVHWIEDLLASMQLKQVRGIDVGCGSSCIYSLLAAKMHKWRMLALESNTSNKAFAKQNIEQNRLEDLIKIYEQEDRNVIFKDYFGSLSNDNAACDETYHFSLCNPPFYDSLLPDPFNGNTRNPDKRPPPHNCHTGRIEELACAGGEVKFVQRIIEESEEFKDRCIIFTSMLGHKKSLTEILTTLKQRDITNVATTEFCQGNTTRWGVAWSFTQSLKSN